MNFFSSSNPATSYKLYQALNSGLAPDGGLYMPETIPNFNQDDLDSMMKMSLPELAAKLMLQYLSPELNNEQVQKICNESFTFDAPLIFTRPGMGVLELFHGPTLAFKDFGSRFLARLLSTVLDPAKTMTILVATSGDTGGAVASSFFKLPGVRVVVLYPEDRVSPYQEQQFASLGHNIQSIKIGGTFDDCQRLVKSAFNDRELREKLLITSANSINIGRWIPQSVYYFYSYFQWKTVNKNINPVFSVPSGNYGNLSAGLLAKKMGLPVDLFIAASNINNTVSSYLESGIYEPMKAIPTIASAMDVGDPSNFRRLLSLTGNIDILRSMVKGYEVSDKLITDEIRRVLDESGYMLDPHSAAGHYALRSSGLKGIALGTAHPVKFIDKFPDDLRDAALERYTLPANKMRILSTRLGPGYEEFRNYLSSM
jgi:threonine synthase